VERLRVRLTCLSQQSTMTLVSRPLFVVATYKAAGESVELKQFCGDLCTLEQDRKTIEHSRTLQHAIEEACKRLGLTVRAGMDKEAGAAS